MVVGRWSEEHGVRAASGSRNLDIEDARDYRWAGEVGAACGCGTGVAGWWCGDEVRGEGWRRSVAARGERARGERAVALRVGS